MTINISKNVAFLQSSQKSSVEGIKPFVVPIEGTQNAIEGKIDNVIENIETGRKKKSYRRAVFVSLGVIFTTALVAVLNPRMSGKTFEKLKTKTEALRADIERTKNNFIKNKWYKLRVKMLSFATKAGEIGNDINNGKDILWQDFCTQKKDFSGIKSNVLRTICEKVDNTFVFLMKKPHEAITRGFDKITRRTVKSRYKRANKQCEKLECLINGYKQFLPAEDLQKVNNKLREIFELRKLFAETEVEARLEEQGKLMENLEESVKSKFVEYGKNIFNKNGQPVKDKVRAGIKDLKFFSEEILRPQKELIETERNNFSEALIRKASSNNGKYDEILSIMEPYITKEKKSVLDKSLKKACKRIHKAGYTEYSEYFDKKRDLTLGSAPTDVVTALLGLGLAGYAVGKAKNKNERVNRTVAVGIPAVLAVGTSLTLTSLLFTGVRNWIVSGIVAWIFSKTGSYIANKITGQKDEIVEDGEPFLLAKSAN